MKNWNIEWKDVKKELPQKSGQYLTFKDFKYFISVDTLNFSEKHKMFNAQDDEETPADKIDVDFWAKIPVVEK